MKNETRTTLIIKQKCTNSGSIYDIRSDNCEITIALDWRFNYAVVVPSWYNIQASRHKTIESANKKYKSMIQYHPIIIRKDGYRIYINEDGHSHFDEKLKYISIEESVQ